MATYNASVISNRNQTFATLHVMRSQGEITFKMNASTVNT